MHIDKEGEVATHSGFGWSGGEQLVQDKAVNFDNLSKEIEKLIDSVDNTTLNVNFDQSGDVKLETNYKLNKMHIRGPHNFIIGDKDIVLTVDTLQNDWGDNIITGSGTLTIIAKNILGLGDSPFNSGENSGNLRIIYYPSNSDDLIIWNNTQVGAQIIAPKSKVYLGEGGNTDNNGEELEISDLISTKPATEN